MGDYSLRARWVLPVDRPPIEGGYVAIAAGRIASVGAVRPASGPVDDLGDVVLLPGFVNAHTHLEFSDLAAPLGQPGISLPAWIRLVIAERKRGNHDAGAAIVDGVRESLASGVTTIGEISAAPAEAGRSVEAQPTTVAFQESIGFSAQRVESAFADLERRYHRALAPAGLSPHAPYTVHPRLVECIVRLAVHYRAPIAMHLAESPEELQLLATGDGAFRELLEERSMWDGTAIPRNSAPINYLQRLARAPRALVIHGNYLTADEIDFVAQRQDTMSVVYCPRTHAYFGHARYPLDALLAAGAHVALGTDSRASNPDLSLLAELRFAAGVFPRVNPAAWLRMATLDAAVALGLGDEVGTLTAGKRADFVTLGCGALETDPAAAIVTGECPLNRVWLAGQMLPGVSET